MLADNIHEAIFRLYLRNRHVYYTHYYLQQNVLQNNNNNTGSVLKSNINITNMINSNKKNKNSIKKIASIKNNNIVNCVK